MELHLPLVEDEPRRRREGFDPAHPATVNEDRPPSMAAGLCKEAPSGRAGVRLGGLTWGVCSGSKRREAPCGKRLEPMCREVVLGVRPSTNSPDEGSIRACLGLGNTENLVH